MNVNGALVLAGVLAVAWAMAYASTPLIIWTLASAAGLAVWSMLALPGQTALIAWAVFLAVALPLNVPVLRRALISGPLLKLFRRALPRISQTERDAIDAGTVWWDGDLFSGRPDWTRLLAFPKPALTDEEQAFLDGPTEALCRMVDDWKVTHELNDLPPEVWQFIKDRGFLGMIIPKRWGGLGFSALAHSTVVSKISTRSATAAVTVMVPNSLGPAELVLHYGTEGQKRHYLPRLAKGQDIPCFALTGPEAGSDAASIPDRGVVCMGLHEGREVLGIRLSWEKRYITLAPVATVLGLAFRLYDPQRLIGTHEDVGITLALIPTHHPGVQIGRRHLPLNVPFMNGPTWGKDVFIPMDWVIGGRDGAGHGWRMLMECLAAGRSISLPAQSVAVAKLAARATGAYARVRTQFKTRIGRFEGVEEALARIGGNAYLMEATRQMTAGAVDLGEKPAVLSAIAKYHMTERARQLINDAMDVHGGKGICVGPKNYLARAYQAMPIGITVEGANILTRSLIIFGQGAVRCHPWMLKEMAAAREPDQARAVRDFDRALFGHVGFIVTNLARTLALSLTAGRLAAVPGDAAIARYYRSLSRMAAAFALMADVAMLVLGGALKRKEKLSARLGDVLSQMYLASATLKRYEDDGRPAADLPLLHWALQDCLHRMQQAAEGFLANFPNRPLAVLLRILVFPLGLPFAPPGDRLGAQVARLLTESSATRERLTAGIYLPRDESDAIGCVEQAMQAAIAAEPVLDRLREAVKSGRLSAADGETQVAQARELGLITAEEAELLARARRLQRAAIAVDDFPMDLGRGTAGVAAAASRQVA